jgi:hypothetical protein
MRAARAPKKSERVSIWRRTNTYGLYFLTAVVFFVVGYSVHAL